MTGNALSLWRFLTGTAIVSFAFPVGQTVSIAIYSKCLGKILQGTMMGVLAAVGSISRLIGPLWIGFSFEKLGSGLVFGITGAGLTVSLILFVLSIKRLNLIIAQNNQIQENYNLLAFKIRNK